MTSEQVIALVGDLHGNLPATQALSEDIDRRKIDTVWCLGDLVGKGPSSAETFDWALARCQLILRGNWDEGVGKKEFRPDEYYYRQLGEKRMRALKSFPSEHSFTLSGKRIRLLHGRPIMPTLLHIQDKSELLLPLFAPDYRVVIYADCHRQGLRTLDGDRQLCNCGSVGNALGVVGVQYIILRGTKGDAPAPLDITFVTLPYDREQAVRDAQAHPDLPKIDSYINEVRTGIYSR